MSNFRPMKGVVAPTDLTTLRYPILASEKIDGWRALVCDIEWARNYIPCAAKHQEYFDAASHAIVLSASLKPISNWSVQRLLDKPELVGCDGELIASTKFNETSSAFATYSGSPAFAFHIFDLFDRPNDTFSQRLTALEYKSLPHISTNADLHKHPHEELLDSMDLTEFLEHLPEGAEGAVTRDPAGPYKYGRSTPKQQWMLKIKPFVDAEAIVVGAEELMHNCNDPEVSQLGLQRRSSHAANKVPSGKLGALVCRFLENGQGPDAETGLIVNTLPTFKVGTGFTDAERHTLWSQRSDLFGRIIKFKAMKHGVLEAPRHPVFLGFREEDYSA